MWSLVGREYSNISKVGSTYIYDDVQRFIVGKENTHTPAVLHDSVVMEVQFVHCVVGSLVVRAGLRVLGDFSGSEHSKAKLRSSSHALQEKQHDVPLCRFHSCKKAQMPAINKGSETGEERDREMSNSTTAPVGTGTAHLRARAAGLINENALKRILYFAHYQLF